MNTSNRLKYLLSLNYPAQIACLIYRLKLDGGLLDNVTFSVQELLQPAGPQAAYAATPEEVDEIMTLLRTRIDKVEPIYDSLEFDPARVVQTACITPSKNAGVIGHPSVYESTIMPE